MDMMLAILLGALFGLLLYHVFIPMFFYTLAKVLEIIYFVIKHGIFKVPIPKDERPRLSEIFLESIKLDESVFTNLKAKK